MVKTKRYLATNCDVLIEELSGVNAKGAYEFNKYSIVINSPLKKVVIPVLISREICDVIESTGIIDKKGVEDL